MDDDGDHILTCKQHAGGHNKLTLSHPQSPYNYILNAQQPDQLTQCVQIPRISSSINPMNYSTKFAMVQCRSGFSGVDTMNISTHSYFSKISELLSQHENTSIIGRNDIRLLLNQKVTNKQISPKLAESLIAQAKQRYSHNYLRKHTQGATYVTFSDIICIHLHESSEEQKILVINDVLNHQNWETLVKRSWPILINVLQTEDCQSFGTHFSPIP